MKGTGCHRFPAADENLNRAGSATPSAIFLYCSALEMLGLSQSTDSPLMKGVQMRGSGWREGLRWLDLVAG